MRQERRVPPHAGGLHPAMQQRGRAIPSSHIVPKVDGRPDHVVIEKMRPPLGAAGRVVPTPSGSNSMGIIMPLYTIGIFLFFLYTIAKVSIRRSDSRANFFPITNSINKLLCNSQLKKKFHTNEKISTTLKIFLVTWNLSIFISNVIISHWNSSENEKPFFFSFKIPCIRDYRILSGIAQKSLLIISCLLYHWVTQTQLVENIFVQPPAASVPKNPMTHDTNDEGWKNSPYTKNSFGFFFTSKIWLEFSPR